MERMRVVLADDQAAVRAALRLLVEKELGLQVVADVATTTELLEVLPVCNPNLVLLHWRLPGVPATELLPVLHHRFAQLRIIVLSVHLEAESAALAAGADAFISKVESPLQVVKIIGQFLANS
jgi:two-component system, NarL family, invasion response regulator UvrY